MRESKDMTTTFAKTASTFELRSIQQRCTTFRTSDFDFEVKRIITVIMAIERWTLWPLSPDVTWLVRDTRWRRMRDIEKSIARGAFAFLSRVAGGDSKSF